MNELDSQIISLLQKEFPLCEEPYKVLADKLQISTEQLWNKVTKMLDDGVIRRLGVSLDSRKLGFTSTLASVSVEPDQVERAAAIIGDFHQVTHSYLRKGRFNIWFTLIAADEDEIARILKQIQSSLKIDDSQLLNLPMKRLFKLDARFDVTR